MTTLLLLLEDVEDLGRSGDVVKVKPGFARNFLLPRGVAVAADKNALRMQEKLQEERKLKAAQDKKESEELAGQLENITLETTVKVDHEGHMYGSVAALDVVHLLKEQQGLEMDKRDVLLKHPIKTTGIHSVELKLKEGITGAVTLKVMPEGGSAVQASKEAAAEVEQEAESGE